MATGPAVHFGNLVFPLNKVTSSVGRKDRITNMVPDVDLGNLNAERSVSRRHAEFAYDHGTTIVRDIGSTNGSSVNGEKLAVQVDRALQDGDTVAFGAVTLTFQAAAEWPEGVEAEWPPEIPEPSPEETMIVGGAEETMVANPYASEETMVAPPATFDAGETAVIAPSMPDAPPPPPEPVYVPEPAEPMAACTNHAHMMAVGICPGCLDPFCVDCLPEGQDGLMVCNRCAGIYHRLTGAGAA